LKASAVLAARNRNVPSSASLTGRSTPRILLLKILVFSGILILTRLLRVRGPRYKCRGPRSFTYFRYPAALAARAPAVRAQAVSPSPQSSDWVVTVEPSRIASDRGKRLTTFSSSSAEMDSTALSNLVVLIGNILSSVFLSVTERVLCLKDPVPLFGNDVVESVVPGFVVCY